MKRINFLFSIYLMLPVVLGRGVHSATEISTRSRYIMILGSKVRSVRRTDNLAAICGPIV
jgi:hypothetical protein